MYVCVRVLLIIVRSRLPFINATVADLGINVSVDQTGFDFVNFEVKIDFMQNNDGTSKPWRT